MRSLLTPFQLFELGVLAEEGEIDRLRDEEGIEVDSDFDTSRPSSKKQKAKAKAKAND